MGGGDFKTVLVHYRPQFLMELADFLFLALFSIGLPLFFGFAVAAAADPPQNQK